MAEGFRRPSSAPLALRKWATLGRSPSLVCNSGRGRKATAPHGNEGLSCSRGGSDGEWHTPRAERRCRPGCRITACECPAPATEQHAGHASSVITSWRPIGTVVATETLRWSGTPGAFSDAASGFAWTPARLLRRVRRQLRRLPLARRLTAVLARDDHSFMHSQRRSDGSRPQYKNARVCAKSSLALCGGGPMHPFHADACRIRRDRRSLERPACADDGRGKTPAVPPPLVDGL
jgi:hypothetical protein